MNDFIGFNLKHAHDYKLYFLNLCVCFFGSEIYELSHVSENHYLYTSNNFPRHFDRNNVRTLPKEYFYEADVTIAMQNGNSIFFCLIFLNIEREKNFETFFLCVVANC